MAENYTSTVEFQNRNMSLFDTRVYRKLTLAQKGEGKWSEDFYPHWAYDSFVTDFWGTPQGTQNILEENKKNITGQEEKELTEKKEYVKEFNEKYKDSYLAPRAFIHPYALIKLTGASGTRSVVEGAYTYDHYTKRKFYEIDGQSKFSGNYSKTPTTTTLIRWGNESKLGKTPYCYQDFVFCKNFGKIENNRLITLRRYAAPVTDNIEFADYQLESFSDNDTGLAISIKNNNTGEVMKYKGSNATNPWTPLATAVTYFGEDTGNKISDILRFSAKYNWMDIEANKQPIDISASQNDAGSNLFNKDGAPGAAISGGLNVLAKAMGILGEAANGRTLNLDGAPGSMPPDPYSQGPYENRIMGPVNVIMNTTKRERGLKFTQDGLKIKFSYIARPIAGINSKAVLLDLLANMLVLTYSSGTWFGGMWRFKASGKPAVYPFKYGDSMNKLYQGKLFGRDSFSSSLIKSAIDDSGDYASTFFPEMVKSITNIFGGAMAAALGFIKGDTEKKESGLNKLNEGVSSSVSKAIQKAISAKALKGTTIPYIEGQRALLTGEPVGDWHLTIGNPLNPIATIGNLVVKDVTIEFSEELGPDDFPIGFDATVTLQHGMGRDRDAIESMFNRGFGRIYTLPENFRSSADGETRVDENTGMDGKPRTLYEETRNTMFTGGTRFIAKTQESELKNKGRLWTDETSRIEALKPTSAPTQQSVATYYVNPWQMAVTL